MIPVQKSMNAAAGTFTDKGNFGLWYWKLVPINNNLEACGCDGKKESSKQLYLEQYRAMAAGQKETLNKSLIAIHKGQEGFCAAQAGRGQVTVTLAARLKTPLITGIGHPHPSETGMLFDRNLGLPYIPASSIKGIVRFAHTVTWIVENQDKLVGRDSIDDDKEVQYLAEIFGTQKNRGNAVFLDSYPVFVPGLAMDIMNPHYNKYYQEGMAPTDNMDPVPVKFLTVAVGTVFIFRAASSKGLENNVKAALKRALTQEGIGAKTSIGHGLFEIIKETEPEPDDYKAWEQQATKSAAARGGTQQVPAAGPMIKATITSVAPTNGIFVDMGKGESGLISATDIPNFNPAKYRKDDIIDVIVKKSQPDKKDPNKKFYYLLPVNRL